MVAGQVTLSLVSHTNVGKTTLARTLLRRDVGEVLDQAHVTEVSEAHELIEAEGRRLVLWDTPGFGDTARLVRRLKREGDPVGWFLHQVWDRLTDRPLWCGQQAARNVREDADVVLYLVPATEDPADAGYVEHEMELLDWLGKPVLVLLNQTGEDGDTAAMADRWRRLTERWPQVRGVLELDAFTRGWVEEGVLFRRVAELLPGDEGEAMTGLARAWNDRNLDVFRASIDALAAHVVRAVTDREPLTSVGAGRAEKKAAMARLSQRQRQAVEQLVDVLVDLHGLQREDAVRIAEHLEHDFALPGAPVSLEKGALWGSVLSGAVGGLAADALAGGLTFGGGLVAGALVGALGGAGLARGFQVVGATGEPAVRWSEAFLGPLLRDTALRYLAVAHFGRGAGAYREAERPARWRESVEAAFAASAVPVANGASEDELLARVRADLDGGLRRALRRHYPSAGDLLDA